MKTVFLSQLERGLARPRVSAGEILLSVARGGLEVDLDGEIHALQERATRCCSTAASRIASAAPAAFVR